MKRMKKHLSMLLILVVALAAFGCGKKEEAVKEGALYTPGTYTAEEKGHNGNVKVTVTVTEDKIENIEVDLMDETEGIAGPAAEKIVDLVLKNQGLGVDTVSGATVSSTAILAAITAALKEAGADVEALKNIKAEEEVLEVSDKEADIVIIGAGGAGMAAAVEAATLGKSVIIVEKMPIVGGNTNRATGGINAAETSIQEKEGIEDTIDTYYDDTFKGGKEENDPELLRVMVENSAEAVDWLNELGAGLTRVSLSGGATNPRIHTPEDGSAVGPVVVKVLENKLKELGVEILMETTATSILEENGAAAGVEVENVNGNSFKIHAKAVIIASGGFGANSEMVEGFRADLVGFSTTNHSGATGDGIELGQEVGAALDDIEQIQIHPTTDPESGYMFTEGLRGDGAILLNSEGVRFTDELLTRDVVSGNILKQEGGIAYLVTNEEMKEENAALAGYIKKGYATECATLADVAKAIGAEESAVTESMAKYKEAVAAGTDAEFGREHLTKDLAEGPYYILKVTPGIHHTMGGLKINTTTHVMNTEGSAIKGLYAAGEVTGGIHGANRIGGNAVTDIIVFGRIAGKTAAEELSK